MRAVVASAGQGTRMLPLTEKIPKPMVPVLGKPFLHYVLTQLDLAGYTDLTVVTGFRSDTVEQWVRTLPFEVQVVDQHAQFGSEHHGTAMPVKAVRELVGQEPFVYYYGDSLFSVPDLEHMQIQDGILRVARFRSDFSPAYGQVVTDWEGYVQKIAEKSEKKLSDFINVGLYTLTPAIFEVIDQVGPSPRGEYELTDAINSLAAKHTVKAVDLKDWWVDFSSASDLPKVETFLHDHGF